MFDKNLKQLRKERNLTQTELALHLQVSLGAIGNWETGNRTPDAQMLLTIADFFGISIDRLLRNPNSADTPFSFSIKEKRLISAYRNQPDIQLAVDRLLGIDAPLYIGSANDLKVAAFSGANSKPIATNKDEIGNLLGEVETEEQ